MDYSPVRVRISHQPRIVSHFSCGAASAVATKLVLQDYPTREIVILNAFIVEEHEDNQRFKADCQRWFDHPIVTVRDEIYGASVHEVWRRHQWIIGHNFAKCSVALKKDVLNLHTLPNDIFVLGYTADEEARLDRFLDANNGRRVLTPLIDYRLTKADCLALVEKAGITLPAMYQLGFNNNNCIGCCKGGEGYMNRVRDIFGVHWTGSVYVPRQAHE